MAIKSSTDVFNCRLDAWQERFSENGRQIGRKYSSGCMMYREQKAENTKKKGTRDTYNMCVRVMYIHVTYVHTYVSCVHVILHHMW